MLATFAATFATFGAPRRMRHASHVLHRFLCLTLLLGAFAALSGCGSDSTTAPAGLAYNMPSAVYEAGQPIVANRPSASGDPVERYSVAPALPAGLTLDPASGVITGTPAAVSAATVYVVTAQNAGGSATTRVQIEVRSATAAPAGLTYGAAAVVYTVGTPIPTSTPTSTGGPIRAYTIAPALPAGLSLDGQTGTISGTPTAASPDTAYTISGSNAAGVTTATLRITVQPALMAPASVVYATPKALYVTGEAIVPNGVQTTGGAPAAYAIAPALPAGLSLNTQTGVISGIAQAIQGLATYTVTASNLAGTTQAQVQIGITSRGSVAAVAPIPGARHYFAATRLPNGNVLATGGYAGSGVTNSAMIFDPATNAWTAAASMLAGRSDHTATVLLNGKVLVIGGQQDILTALASAEIYDPATNTWQAAASMSTARVRHSATLLPNGKVLVIGGYDPAGSITFWQTAELYDPTTDTWTPMTTQLSQPRGQHGAELLPGGNTVLLIGGVNRTGYVRTAEFFPVDDSGTTTATDLGIQANVCQSVTLTDASVLAACDTGSTAWRYVPATGTWTTSTYNGPRSLPFFVALADGRALIAGGLDLATTEIYNPDFNTWTAGAPLTQGRRAGAAALLNDGNALLIGGYANNNDVATTERFAP